MVFDWPQIIYLVLTLLGLGITLAKHGEPKKDKHNFYVTFVGSGLIVALLYWGGFFTV